MSLVAQSVRLQPEKERELRYTPSGDDFVIVNGNKKFNRALYGTNTAFRIETGDVPEFGFFMPNMGGNMQLGIVSDHGSLWLNEAKYIKSIYRAGSRIYELNDPMIGKGTLEISVLAMSNAEGMVMQIRTENIPANTSLLCLFGGASNKRFSRNGDLGVDDPIGFSLQPDACRNNSIQITGNTFQLRYALESKSPRGIAGLFPVNALLKTGSPYATGSPAELWQSSATDNKPVLVAKVPLRITGSDYVVIKNDDSVKLITDDLKKYFDSAEQRRKEIAGTIKTETPDPFISPLGGVLSTAADAIWEDSWLHGAIGWRMPLNGWRAAYTGDVLGWHQRSRKHFDSYAASQITRRTPDIPHPTQDTTLNLARAEKKWGTQMYSNGYVCRNPNDTTKMHHYDMNLCYIDELLNHFNWTGDLEYVRKMWPVLENHLAWEKRNFDPDNDGLYDAYACIWASDALFYNSGGVTHSSAYNYRANKRTAEIAEKIGKNPKPYAMEAEKILQAVNSQLWLSGKGWWAEFKDFMGNKSVHPSAAVWTVYHAIDSEINTPFQAYQATRYIDSEIPKIPVRIKGLNDSYYTISTTNWLPYSWSINNVAFAEVAHTSLAYWQAGRYDEAFILFKSSVLDGMYAGSSPGNIGQISSYDAARGECYRDFGDPIGIYSRVLIQGLFGIKPDLMNNRLVLQPGFPNGWDHASVSTPDIDFSFKRENHTDNYHIKTRFNRLPEVELLLKAPLDEIENVFVNSKKQSWTIVDAVGFPMVKITCKPSASYVIKVVWKGKELQKQLTPLSGVKGEMLNLTLGNNILKIQDPQGVLLNPELKQNSVTGILSGEQGPRTLFVQEKQGQMVWWEPVSIEIKEPFSANYDPEQKNLQFTLKNNTNQAQKIELSINSYSEKLDIKPGEVSEQIRIPSDNSVFGTNRLSIFDAGKLIYETDLVNWNLENPRKTYETIDIDRYLNAQVTDIFKQKYLSPRSPYTTLQLPKQGIGEWCHPLATATIDDSGLRKAANNNVLNTGFSIPFRTTADSGKPNIAFTSLWDNYPRQIAIPLSGKASHAYLMMAGSTNHMQCHVSNGTVTICYTDGTQTSLNLINPESWLPIEQDLYIDGFAFRSKLPRPYRIAFKSGIVSRDLGTTLNINPAEVYGRVIDGGAGVILDLPLDPQKELKSASIQTIANDVVIGLMSLTLLR